MADDVRIAHLGASRDGRPLSRPRKVAFFGHDAADAAVRRRIQAFQDDGVSVTGFMMRRGEDAARDWPNVDLGQTHDSAFVQRIRQVFAGAAIAATPPEDLAAADLIYARNLDMLICAFLAKRKAGLKTPVVYESLDVHRLLTRSGIVGMLMRYLERTLLSRCLGLVVSSPGFLRNHFERHYPGRYTAALVENRLAAGADFGPRPAPRGLKHPGRLSLGWVGMLRCQRSFTLLCQLADQFPDTLHIHLHGLPARTEIEVFEPEIDRRANMTYHGRYKSPEDLGAIYGGLDVVWAGDFMEAGYNSVWLLPNRIYEGGYYGRPSIAPEGTETAAWVEARKGGFTVAEPLDQTLPALVRTLLSDPSRIETCSRNLLARPEDDFVQPHGLLAEMLDRFLDAEVPA